MSPTGGNDFDSDRAGNFVRVMKENRRYRMWYVGQHRAHTGFWPTWYRSGYAESSDGIHFQRVMLGLETFGGNSSTNILPDFPYVPFVAYDPANADPRRRHKVLRFPNTIMHGDYAKQGLLDPWSESYRGVLLTSWDGIHWTEHNAEMGFPGGRPGELIPQSLFFD